MDSEKNSTPHNDYVHIEGIVSNALSHRLFTCDVLQSINDSE